MIQGDVPKDVVMPDRDPVDVADSDVPDYEAEKGVGGEAYGDITAPRRR